MKVKSIEVYEVVGQVVYDRKTLNFYGSKENPLFLVQDLSYVMNGTRTAKWFDNDDNTVEAIVEYIINGKQFYIKSHLVDHSDAFTMLEFSDDERVPVMLESLYSCKYIIPPKVTSKDQKQRTYTGPTTLTRDVANSLGITPSLLNKKLSELHIIEKCPGGWGLLPKYVGCGLVTLTSRSAIHSWTEDGVEFVKEVLNNVGIS